MPIKNLTDKPNPIRGMIRIGQLFKGEPRPEDGRRPGEELDYFRVEFLSDTADQMARVKTSFAPAWNKLYGDQPKSISGVYFLDDAVDIIFATWMLDYKANKLVRRCDGAEQLEHRLPNGEMSRDPIPCAVASGEKCDCKHSGLLRFMLPLFNIEVGVFGYFTLNTHGVVDIANMHGALCAAENINGTLLKVPFVLSRVPKEFQIPIRGKDGSTKQSKVTKHLCQLEMEPSHVRKLAIQVLGGKPPALGAGDITPPENESAAQTDAPLAEVWWEDETKTKYFEIWCTNRGYAPGWLPGPRSDYATVKEACAAVQAVAKQYKTQPPADEVPPDEEEDGRTPEDGDPVDSAPLAPNLLEIAGYCAQLGVSEGTMRELLGVKSFAELGSTESVLGSITALAVQEQMPVIVERCQYLTFPKAKGNKSGRMLFKTLIGTVVYFEGRKKLLEFYETAYQEDDAELTDEYKTIPDWQDGTHELPEPLLLYWKQEPNGQFTVDHFDLAELDD